MNSYYISALAEARGRARAAFKLNGIPWSEELNRLSVPVLLDTAEYWEQRHEDAQADPGFWERTKAEAAVIAEQQAVRFVRDVVKRTGVEAPPREGAQAQTRSEKTYHGWND